MIRILIILVLLATGCSNAVGIVAPIALDSPLPQSSPEQAGLDTTYLSRVVDHFRADPAHRIHSMLVARGGHLVIEEYFNGFGRDNPHDLRSATKSITSLLTGIAIENGHLDGLDASMISQLDASYGSNAKSEGKHDILIRHLLTMSSGLDCDDGDPGTRGQEDRMYRSRDWVSYFLSLDRVHSPGEAVRYCTGGVVALGETIAHGSGRDVESYADQTLFEPMGIKNLRWDRFDQGRKVDTGGHLLLTPQAMVKMGMLILRNGTWNGKQLVPANWIVQSTQPQVDLNGESYGFLWWHTDLPFTTSDEGDLETRKVEVISARGNGGQVIFVVPEFDLVAVFTAGYYNSEETGIVYNLFRNAVLTSLPEMRKYIPGRQ